LADLMSINKCRYRSTCCTAHALLLICSIIWALCTIMIFLVSDAIVSSDLCSKKYIQFILTVW
jgi:hypothetical protein